MHWNVPVSPGFLCSPPHLALSLPWFVKLLPVEMNKNAIISYPGMTLKYNTEHLMILQSQSVRLTIALDILT